MIEAERLATRSRGAARCPLCGSAMRLRARDPLARIFWGIVLYGTVFLALYLMPDIKPASAVGLVILGLWALLHMRRAPRLWCAECWHEADR